MNTLRPLILIASLGITLTATGLAITEHRAAQEATTKSANLSSKVGTLESDLVAAKRSHAFAEAHAGALQLQLDTLKSTLDEKTALIRVIQNK